MAQNMTYWNLIIVQDSHNWGNTAAFEVIEIFALVFLFYGHLMTFFLDSTTGYHS